MAKKDRVTLKVMFSEEQTKWVRDAGITADEILVRDVPSEIIPEILPEVEIPRSAPTRGEPVAVTIDEGLVAFSSKSLNPPKSKERIADYEADKTYLNVAEAAERLNITKKSIYRWFQEGKLTRVRFQGGKHLVLESEIEQVEKARNILRAIES